MQIEEVFITKNADETEKIGQKLAKHLQAGDVVLLVGELGGGKTTFTRGLVEGLGFTDRVVSPTFALLRSYESGNRNHESGIQIIYHLDLYRLQNVKDLESLDLHGMFEDWEALTIIEWPELARESLSGNNRTIKISFEHIDLEKRKIVISTES